MIFWDEVLIPAGMATLAGIVQAAIPLSISIRDHGHAAPNDGGSAHHRIGVTCLKRQRDGRASYKSARARSSDVTL